MISPGEFIPLLEETGLIVDVGVRVIEKACRCLHEWRARTAGSLRAGGQCLSAAAAG